ncbi:hypothetical protein [Burkholderia multivorans]|uniref:hypothetical protein n=1 Tax=Burkholderia multivorans TaxID=87883 RepID=UPI0011B84A45|nr:hypothetical protein [Burkholderia multivorans]MBR8044532.1 hypothetical protein [Burkholderia multivorans]MBU9662285.1 hypothetical protein [Burkholderia multivorans]
MTFIARHGKSFFDIESGLRHLQRRPWRFSTADLQAIADCYGRFKSLDFSYNRVGIIRQRARRTGRPASACLHGAVPENFTQHLQENKTGIAQYTETIIDRRRNVLQYCATHRIQLIIAR